MLASLCFPISAFGQPIRVNAPTMEGQVERLLVSFGQQAHLREGTPVPYHNPENAYQLLVGLGQPAVEIMEKILKEGPGKFKGDRQINLKVQAARALARIDRTKYLPMVREALAADPDAMHDIVVKIVAGDDKPFAYPRFEVDSVPMRSMSRAPEPGKIENRALRAPR